MPDDLEGLIRSLAAPDQTERERSAHEIFDLGLRLALPVIEGWLADKELAVTLVLDASDFPEATVGLAVIPRHFEEIRVAWGSPRLADVPADQDAMEFEIHPAHEARLDILTTSQPGGPGAITRFLQRSGEGIQQVELLVHDVDRATDILRAKHDLEPVYPQTRAGADNTRVNFFLVATPQSRKVLMELVEAAH